MKLVKVYCAKAVRDDARRLRYGQRNTQEKERMGLRFAEEIRPGIWMCLCCSKRVNVAA